MLVVVSEGDEAEPIGETSLLFNSLSSAISEQPQSGAAKRVYVIGRWAQEYDLLTLNSRSFWSSEGDSGEESGLSSPSPSS